MWSVPHFVFPKRPDGRRDPPKGTRGSLTPPPPNNVGQSVKPKTHLHLVPRSETHAMHTDKYTIIFHAKLQNSQFSKDSFPYPIVFTR